MYNRWQHDRVQTLPSPSPHVSPTLTLSFLSFISLFSFSFLLFSFFHSLTKCVSFFTLSFFLSFFHLLFSITLFAGGLSTTDWDGSVANPRPQNLNRQFCWSICYCYWLKKLEVLVSFSRFIWIKKLTFLYVVSFTWFMLNRKY